MTVEQLTKLGLNERQQKAVEYVKEKGKITNKEYQNINSISERTASRELSELVDKEVLKSLETKANAFFRSGYIESWGRGITKMTNLCLEAGLPRPAFHYKASGIWAVFQKDILNV